MPESTSAVAARPESTGPAPLYHRHAWPVRLMHWINALSFVVLLMSGLMIFNAHPSLDWGKSSYTGRPSILEIGSRKTAEGRPIGFARVFGHEFETTGVLGLTQDASGRFTGAAFPSWATLPGSYSLAKGRLWHFFFAWLLVLNGVAYVAYAVYSRHLQRDLAPTRSDWRGIGRSIVDHLCLRHPVGEAAKHYNVLQKLAYLLVIFGLLPLVVVAGWAMSPWLNSLLPGWVDLLGGRQSARSLHFLAAWLLVGFVAVHVFEVILSGPFNQLRSMITGRYRVPQPAREPRHG